MRRSHGEGHACVASLVEHVLRDAQQEVVERDTTLDEHVGARLSVERDQGLFVARVVAQNDERVDVAVLDGLHGDLHRVRRVGEAVTQ